MSLPKNALRYLKGLLRIFENANCVALARISQCSHDSLARVLNGKKFCWQTLLQNFLLRTFGKLQAGYLIIDDTVISKRFSRAIENLTWVFDSKIGKSIRGLNLVMLAWSNGEITIPLAIKVYQKSQKKSKIDLAIEPIDYARKLGIKPNCITFDSWYAATRLLQKAIICQWTFITQVKKNRKLDNVPLKKVFRNPYWIKQGIIAGGIKISIVRNGKKYFAANDLSLTKEKILSLYRGRWLVETIFRVLHSELGLDECQARKLDSQIIHFHLCLLAYAALEKERFIQNKTIYETKRNCSFDFQTADNILFRLNFKGA